MKQRPRWFSQDEKWMTAAVLLLLAFVWLGIFTAENQLKYMTGRKQTQTFVWIHREQNGVYHSGLFGKELELDAIVSVCRITNHGHDLYLQNDRHIIVIPTRLQLPNFWAERAVATINSAGVKLRGAIHYWLQSGWQMITLLLWGY